MTLGRVTGVVDSTSAIRRERDRVLVRSFVSGAAGRLLTPLFGAVTIAVATRGLGDVRFGVVAALSAIVALIGFADFGVSQSLLSRLAAADGRDDQDEMRELVSSAWASLLPIGAVIMAVGAVATVVLPWPSLLGATSLPAADSRAAVFAFFVVVGVAIPAGAGQHVLIGLQRGTTANLWTVAGSVVTMLAVVVAAALHLPLWWFVVATVGGPVAVSAVQTAWLFLWEYPRLRPTRHAVTRRSLRGLVGRGGLFLVLNLAVTVAYQADALIVAGIKGAAAAAVFGIALRLFRLVSGLITGGTIQFWPAMAEALARGDTYWVRSRFYRVTVLTAGGLGALCVLLVLFGRPIARVWAGPTLVPSSSLLVWLAIWTVYLTVMTQVSYLLNAAEIIGPQAVMAVIMAIANVALSIYLTQRIGAVGCIVGSLASHVVCIGVPALILARRVLARPATAPEAAPAR